MSIKYINHLNEELDLSGDIYQIDTEALLDYEWNLDSSDRGNFASKISRFYRNNANNPITVSIYADSKQELNENMKRFFEVVEKDVLTNQAGKIVVTSLYYYDCFVISAVNTYWNEPQQLTNGKYFMNKEIQLYSPRPFWYKTEDTIQFGKTEQGGEPEDPEHTRYYPHGYPYDYYASTGAINEIVNSNIDSADFLMVMHGPVEDPYVTIGETTYAARIELGSNERLELNTREKTIVRAKPDGTRENIFMYRGLDDYIFEKIAPGKNAVVWSGEFTFSITMYQRRSEPIWNY